VKKRLYVYSFTDEPGPSPLVTDGTVVGAQIINGAWHVLVSDKDGEAPPQDWSVVYRPDDPAPPPLELNKP
jgi:hypothetical protein